MTLRSLMHLQRSTRFRVWGLGFRVWGVPAEESTGHIVAAESSVHMGSSLN